MSNREIDELTCSLRERSEVMSRSNLAFDDVKGRARGIQRRRRTASGIAVAASALAIAVPMGISFDAGGRDQQPPAAMQGPSQTTEASGPAELEGPVEIDAATAPRGEDPAILYMTGTTLHRLGEPDVELPEQYSYVVPYGDGWMGLSGARGTTTILDGAGRAAGEPWPGVSGAISSDGQSVATELYTTGGVDAQLWPRAGADPNDGYGSHVVAFDGDLQYAGFVGPETIAYNLTVTGNQGATQNPYVASWFSDEEPRQLTSLLDVRGANDVTGVVSGMTKIDDLAGEFCAAVVKAEADSIVWDTCKYRLGRFSPDGRYVLGVDPLSDGAGTSGVTILDARSGAVVAEFTLPDRSFMQDAIWESKSTVLAPVMQDGVWFLVRMRSDGTVEQALTPSRDGYDDSSPWRFQVTP